MDFILKQFFTTYLHHQWSVNFARCLVLSQEQKYLINKKVDLRNYRQYIIRFDGTCYWDSSLCIFTINIALNWKKNWRICEDVLRWDRSFMESDAWFINCKKVFTPFLRNTSRFCWLLSTTTSSARCELFWSILDI